MEAPLLHQFPIPPPPLPHDALLLLHQHAVSARAQLMTGAVVGTGSNNSKLAPPPLAAAANNDAAAPAPGPGREQCPRCASRDTKFCYYNNYNTAQPRHFCRACRRYWTLGGSLRNVPVGGSARKRPRPRRPVMRPTTHGAMAAAAAAAMAMPPMPSTTTTTAASAGGGPFAASPAATLLQDAAGGGGGLLLSSMLMGTASASALPLLALGAAPLLEGRLGFDLGLGKVTLGGAGAAAADRTAGDLAHQQTTLPLGAGPLPWPTATETILEGDRAETMWKDDSSVFPFPPAAAALWQELAAAAPVVESGGPHLLM